MEKEIIQYIKDARIHGLTDQEIKQNLLDAGWEASVVEDSFGFAKAAESKPLVGNKDEDIKLPAQHAQPASAVHDMLPSQMNRVSVSPHLSITEEHFKQPASGSKSLFKKASFWATLLVLIVLGAGGYYAYANFFNSPTKAWDKFAKLTKNEVYQVDFRFKFSDQITEPSATSTMPLSLGLEGKAYNNGLDKNNPESSAEFKADFTASGTSMSREFKYLLFNKNLYFYFGQLPASYSELFGGKNYEWLKLDLNSLEELSQQGQAATSTEEFKQLERELQEKLNPVWEDADLVKMEQYLGREKVNGINTYHFRNSLDKAALAKALNDSLDIITEASQKLPSNQNKQVTEEEKQAIRTVVQGLMDKYEVKEFETWVGTKDFRLYKIHYVSNFLSLNSFQKPEIANAAPALGTAREKSRDAKRLADVRQLASALELYYNDNNGYPAANNGKPVALAPAYIGTIPESPTPADGPCSNWYNTYWYEPSGKAINTKNGTVYPSYQMYFCLGADTGGYKAGIAKLSPSGIEGGLPCTGTAEQCAPVKATNNAPATEQITQIIDMLDFTAEVRLDLTYSNYGQTKTLEAPAEYWDVLKELKNMFNSFGVNTLNMLN